MTAGRASVLWRQPVCQRVAALRSTVVVLAAISSLLCPSAAGASEGCVAKAESAAFAEAFSTEGEDDSKTTRRPAPQMARPSLPRYSCEHWLIASALLLA